MLRLFFLNPAGLIEVAEVKRLAYCKMAPEGYDGYIGGAGGGVCLYRRCANRASASRVALQLLIHPHYGIPGNALVHAQKLSCPLGTVEELAMMCLNEHCSPVEPGASIAWLMEQGASPEQAELFMPRLLQWTLRHFSTPMYEQGVA